MIERLSEEVQATVLSAVASFQVALMQRRERGATAVEYALMVGLLVLVIVGGVSVFSGRVRGMFTTYGNTLPG